MTASLTSIFSDFDKLQNQPKQCVCVRILLRYVRISVIFEVDQVAKNSPMTASAPIPVQHCATFLIKLGRSQILKHEEQVGAK